MGIWVYNIYNIYNGYKESSRISLFIWKSLSIADFILELDIWLHLAKVNSLQADEKTIIAILRLVIENKWVIVDL